MTPPRGRDRRGGLTAEPHRGVLGGSTPGPIDHDDPDPACQWGHLTRGSAPRRPRERTTGSWRLAIAVHIAQPGYLSIRGDGPGPATSFCAAQSWGPRRLSRPGRWVDDSAPWPRLTCWIDSNALGVRAPPDGGLATLRIRMSNEDCASELPRMPSVQWVLAHAADSSFPRKPGRAALFPAVPAKRGAPRRQSMVESAMVCGKAGAPPTRPNRRPRSRDSELGADDYELGVRWLLGLSSAASPDWSSALTIRRRIGARSGPSRTHFDRSKVISTSPVPAPLTSAVPRQ